MGERSRSSRVAFGVVLLVSLVVLFAPSGDGVSPFPQFDKVVHGGLFLALALSAGWAWSRRARVLAPVLLYAPLSELVQAVALPHRDGDWRDAATDAVGALVGWALCSALGARGRQAVGAGGPVRYRSKVGP